MLISDSNNNMIRMVDQSGIITLIAGTDTGGYSGDNGAATSATLNFPTGVAVDASGRILQSLSAALVHSNMCICDNILDNHKLIFPCPI